MTLKNVIDFADTVKPNTFSNEMKTQWVNECEGLVQTEVFLMNIDDIRTYKWANTATVSVSFPDDHTMKFSKPCGMVEGGTIKIAGLTTYANNNTAVATPIVDSTMDGLTLTFNDGTFTDTGDTEDTATITYDGKDSILLVLPPHDKMYWVYLSAMIDFAFGEYTKYENTMAEFNQRLGEYTRWFATFYKPANRRMV